MPNPAYSPPSRVEKCCSGNAGLSADRHRQRGALARIDGTLFNDVTFGWGIIGHLDQGGHFVVQQADGLGDGSWGITEMSLNMTGKILLFKTISLVSDEVLSDFQPRCPTIPTVRARRGNAESRVRQEWRKKASIESVRCKASAMNRLA